MKKPDYAYLIKLDSWTKKDASLIISGLEPDDYRKIRFTLKYLDFNLYPELLEPYKLYKLFLSMDLYQYGRDSSHPLTYIYECLHRDWPVSHELLEVAKVRYERETGKKLPSREDSVSNNDEPQEAGKKEKSYLLKSLAIMTLLYVSKQNIPRLGDIKNVNVSQVTEDILQFLEDFNLRIYGIGKSSLNQRIAKSLRLISREANDK